MEGNQVSRRQVLKNSARIGAGAAVAGLVHGVAAAAQMPSPQPLDDDKIAFVTTTESSAWQSSPVFRAGFGWDMLNLNIDPTLTRPSAKPVQGFGACFNELGWTSLSALTKQDRDSIMREFFDPNEGARFNYCRMPIGANDFSTEAYSYDETDGDFDLKRFSIDHDRQTLIPFIHAAQRHQPKLRIWASPWTPPSWMKRNHHYAEAKSRPGMGIDNGIRPDQIGHEGEDMFIQEPRYFEAYARYFGRFIDAYAAGRNPRWHGDAAERIQLRAKFPKLYLDARGPRPVPAQARPGDAEAWRGCVFRN